MADIRVTNRITKWGTNEALETLIAHLNELSNDGWEVYHIHEMIASGRPCLLIFSRKVVKTDEEWNQSGW